MHLLAANPLSGKAIAIIIALPLISGFIFWLVRRTEVTERSVQTTVHNLEEGIWRKWILIAVLAATVSANLMLVFWGFPVAAFSGLWHPRAMEQAEIARELARGHGFTTRVIRPAAIVQLESLPNGFPIERTPDIFHAPLWPIALAPFVWLARDTWEMTPKDVTYVSDKVVAGVSVFFFLLSVVTHYFIGKRLFDRRIAWCGVGLMLLCDRLWQFSLSGLPQMLMLFLFSCALYALLRAVEAQCAAEKAAEDLLSGSEPDPVSEVSTFEREAAEEAEFIHSTAPSRIAWLNTPIVWIAVASIFFGLLALTHAISIWVFLGALVFCVCYFPKRLAVAAIMLAIVALAYTPWIIRNCRVGGLQNFGGLAPYTILSGLRGNSEDGIMRSMEPPLKDVGISELPLKTLNNANAQIDSLYTNLGSVLVAPVFFLTLLHAFRRREIATFRWCILLMWLGGLLGSSLFGLDEQVLHANDLNVLFIGAMSWYGLAFVLNVWSRLEISGIRILRIAFFVLLFVLSGRTFICSIPRLISPGDYFHWPPYIPPYIAVMRGWTNEREVIMSDMPWAVAWYADRESLWLPKKISEFTDLNDYRRLKAPIAGMYLTPYSGDKEFLDQIANGEYKDWAAFITRSAANSLKNFPFRAVTSLPRNLECVVYFDRDRWTARED